MLKLIQCRIFQLFVAECVIHCILETWVGCRVNSGFWIETALWTFLFNFFLISWSLCYVTKLLVKILFFLKQIPWQFHLHFLCMVFEVWLLRRRCVGLLTLKQLTHSNLVHALFLSTVIFSREKYRGHENICLYRRTALLQPWIWTVGFFF